MKRLTAYLLALLASCAVLASDIPPPRAVDVGALVRQLGSEDFQEREEASQRLAALPVDEPPAELLAALKSPNPEVRERADKAVKAIRAAAALRRLPREERFAVRGQVDLYVAATATLQWKADDDQLWVPAFELGSKAVANAEMKGDRRPHGGPTFFRDFATYRKHRNPRFIRQDGIYSREAGNQGRPVLAIPEVIQAAGVANPWDITALVVSRGDVSAKAAIGSSLVLANGNVTTADVVHNSVIICDGDVVIKTWVLRSLIIARGNIKMDRISTSNTLIAGGTITIAEPPTPRHIDPKDPSKMILVNIIKEKDINPLGFITFFELSRVGLEVKAAEGGVRVAAVAAGKPCEKAGVKAGDTILEVNGKKPTDAESLRRLLRDALAIGDATVKLQRGDKTETVKVALPE